LDLEKKFDRLQDEIDELKHILSKQQNQLPHTQGNHFIEAKSPTLPSIQTIFQDVNNNSFFRERKQTTTSTNAAKDEEFGETNNNGNAVKRKIQTEEKSPVKRPKK
jgi:Zn-dependent M28 family amino/carboxypeptidase